MEKLIIYGDSEILKQFKVFFNNNDIQILDESDLNQSEELYQCDPATIGTVITVLFGTSGLIPVLIQLFKPNAKKCKIKFDKKRELTELKFTGMKADEIAKILQELDKHEKN